LSEPVATDSLTDEDESIAAAAGLRLAESVPSPADVDAQVEGVTLSHEEATRAREPSNLEEDGSSGRGGIGLQGPALAETQVRATATAKTEDKVALQTAVRLGSTLHAAMQAEAQAQSTVKLSCPNSCSSHGVCNAQSGMCYCSAGYTGSDCSIVDQCKNGCSNNGICQNGQCYCLPTFFMDDCSVPVPTNRTIPPPWVTAIIAAVTFFIGIIVGRKTLASAALANIMKENP